MVIHPKQIKLANEIFAPSNKDFNDAVEMLEAIKKSTKRVNNAMNKNESQDSLPSQFKSTKLSFIIDCVSQCR